MATARWADFQKDKKEWIRGMIHAITCVAVYLLLSVRGPALNNPKQISGQDLPLTGSGACPAKAGNPDISLHEVNESMMCFTTRSMNSRLACV